MGRTGLRTGRTICQVVLMEIPRDGRRFLLTDTGICVQPTMEEKADILRGAVEVAQRLGVSQPRVALMAATETVKAAMPETVEARELTERHGEASSPAAWFRDRSRSTSLMPLTPARRSELAATWWARPTSWSSRTFCPPI